MDYPWAYDKYLEQNKMIWHKEEVPLAEDLRDYNEKLTHSERQLVTQILRFFTQSDCDVAGGYYSHFLPLFKPPEIRMMMGAFAAMEGIHIDAYAFLVDALGLPETDFKVFLDIEEMADKHDYLSKFNTNSKEAVAECLAAYSGFTEGVQLFSSFAMLLNFPRRNLLKNMGQIVSWSIRDENLHVEGMTQLFRTYIEENPELWTDTLKRKLYSTAESIVSLEEKFIDRCFADLEIQGLSPNDVKMYIYFIAGRRLNQLGLKNIFKVDKNPLPWIDGMINAVEHTNFFENRPTEYSKANTEGNWADLF